MKKVIETRISKDEIITSRNPVNTRQSAEAIIIVEQIFHLLKTHNITRIDLLDKGEQFFGGQDWGYTTVITITANKKRSKAISSRPAC